MSEGEISQAAKDFLARVAPKADVAGELSKLKERLEKATPVDIPNVPIPEGVGIDENGSIIDPERKVLGPVNESSAQTINPEDFTFDEEGKIVPKEKKE